MPAQPRTPLGELVFAYRERLHLTQLELAVRTSHPDAPRPDHVSVSERTILDIEQESPTAKRLRKRRPSTVRALADAFGLVPGTPDHNAFLAAAKGARRDRAGTPDDLLAPILSIELPLFVPAGREPHLARLAAAIDAAVRGQPGAIFVSADPGTGKSALVAHACRQAVDRHDRLTVLWGACTGRASAADPHQPFRQALGTLAGDTAAAGPQHLLSMENARRIASRAGGGVRAIVDEAPGLIDRVVPAETLRAQARLGQLDPETVRRLERAVDAGGGMPAAAVALNDQVARAIRRYAATGPIVLVLEDLHWSDPGTAATLRYLLHQLATQRLPVLVIGTFRPGAGEPTIPDDRSPLPGILADATRLFAEPLMDLSDTVGGTAGRSFVDAVVDRILPEAPRAFRQALYRKTAGSPLLVITILRRYESEGPADGGPRWHLDTARLPAAIETLFADLIDRLPPDLAPLLEAASVQGATFSAEVAMRVMELSPADLARRLDDELTHRFRALDPGGVTLVAGQRSHEYQFSHVLFRDYLYDRLAPFRRAALHTATARAMLALYGDGEHDGAGRIAFHFDQAGERRNAAAAYVRAGIHALERQDHDLARIHFDRVGELDLRQEDPHVVAQALLGLGNCAYRLGENDRATVLFERAHDLAQRERVRSLIANTLIAMGWIDYNAGRMQLGADRLGEAIDVLIDLDDPHELCRARVLQSHLLYGLGHYDRAVSAARRAIAGAADLKEDMIVVAGKTALGNCWIDIGSYEDAIAEYAAAIAICEEHGNVHRASLCWVNLALAELERGRWAEASAALAIAFDPERKATSRLLGLAEFNAGLVDEGRGDLADATRRFIRSLEIRRAHGQHAAELDSLAGLLRMAVARQRQADVRSLLAAIEERIAAHGLDGVGHPGRLFVSLILADLDLDDPECARDHARQGVAFVSGRADLLADAAHRRSYRSNVPAHFRLFALAAAQGVAEG